MRIRPLVVSTLTLSLIASGFQNRLRKELESPYKKWLNEDVAYILSDEERQAWQRLATDDEREQFIEQFWLRRDPTPGTAENEFKEEHYRRIAYANERYASGIPGWKTDRGRIYIAHGPPDEIESHPSGGSSDGTTPAYPFEQWRYRWIEAIGTNVVIKFVDPTMTGEYRMTLDPSDNSLTRPDAFERLWQFTQAQRPPVVKFKDLEASVDSAIRFNILPMQIRADYFRLTEASTLTCITVQLENKDLQFQSKDGGVQATVNVYGRITTLTRRATNAFEDTLTAESPAHLLVYQKSLPLPPGQYRLNLVLKDVTSGKMNNSELALNVPRFEPGKLGSSSLVLGETKVRPRLSGAFRGDEQMGIYLQVYNFTGGSIGYEVVKSGSNEKVVEFSELFSNHPAGHVTIEKLLPLASLQPGLYTLRMKINDTVVNQIMTRTADFTVF